MKNVKNLFGMAVMATALVGCSSNDNLNPNPNEGAGKAGTAYASFKINLPTVSGTRAPGDPDGTPDPNSGTAAEYEVKNGTILIFDNSGNFVEETELGTMNPWTDVKTDGVTTAAIATVKLTKVSLGENKYQALVLLNNNSGTTTQKVALPTSSDTYAKWSKEATVTVDNYKSTDGIFMANAPMFTSTTTNHTTTLVPVANVCASPEEAQAKTATTVYVERGLAKVTMKNFDPSYTIKAGTYKDDKVVINNWQLDVTNKSTYPVHQTGVLKTIQWNQTWADRFYDKDNGVFKRVYWGEDPNYDKDVYSNGTTTKSALEYCKDAFNMISNAEVVGLPGDDKPQYCLENTFNLANMMQGQTTRVVFKAVYTPNALKSETVKTFYKIGNNTAVWKGADLETQIKTLAINAMKITDPVEQAMYSVDLAKGSNISGKAGQHLIAADNITFDPGSSTKTSQVTPNVIKEVNKKLGLSEDPTTHKVKVGISTYLNGEAYYIARIKHFNELTPWTPGTAYTDDATFLGRYGVLRNNWYELSVHSVSGLGYPEVPEVKPNVPDDENDKYINVEVKILDWAKRKQVIDL